MIKTVLLDVGNVLTPDPWEALVLTPERGLADRLGIRRAAAENAGRSLWPLFAVDADATEGDWWAAFEDTLGVRVPGALVAEVEATLLVANPLAKSVLPMLAGAFRVGVLTDSTTFWYPKQAGLVSLDLFVDPEIVFVSYREGVEKSAGLFDVAAVAVEPKSTVVVDDRDADVARAAAAGFVPVRYAMT